LLHSPPTACKHAVSGTISLPSQGCFSPFPHGTGSLSVANEYSGLPDGPGRFPQGSTCPAVLRSHLDEVCIFGYGALTLSGRPSHAVFLTLPYHPFNPEAPPPPYRPQGCFRSPDGFRDKVSGLLWSYDPRLSFRIVWFSLLRFRSPLLSESRLFSFPPGTEMVHFPGFASSTYVFSRRWRVFSPAGFPHSDISGSLVACTSPKLFAAGHVLPRLFAPRHPHACS
jgi:hypothetical protein